MRWVPLIGRSFLAPDNVKAGPPLPAKMKPLHSASSSTRGLDGEIQCLIIERRLELM